MSEMSDMARDPKHRRAFEKLLYLAAKRGDADLVEERLAWGVDPNCTFGKNRSPLIGNVKGFSPSADTVRALLKHGADPSHVDETGSTALDYARRKLAKLQARPRKIRKSLSLDENNQLQLCPEEQAEFDKLRAELGDSDDAREYLRMWWKERLRAARRVFNDPAQVELIVQILEEAEAKGGFE